LPLVFRFVDECFVVGEADGGGWIAVERLPAAAAVGFGERRLGMQ
jgi:hypothetical protein